MPVKVGERWDVVNSTQMGSIDSSAIRALVAMASRRIGSWEDVVNLPPKSTTRIAWMADDRPGSWMYHCHILEHHAAGMMAHFDVVR